LAEKNARALERALRGENGRAKIVPNFHLFYPFETLFAVDRLCPTAGFSKSCPEPDPTLTIEFSVNRDDLKVVFRVFGVNEKAATIE